MKRIRKTKLGLSKRTVRHLTIPSLSKAIVVGASGGPCDAVDDWLDTLWLRARAAVTNTCRTDTL